MKSLTVKFDVGHGGMLGGQYQTSGKRSPNWDKGVLFEGMFNRWICNKLMQELDYRRVPYYHVSPEVTDTPLRTRVRRANEIYRADKSTYLLSIHANAGGGTGIEGFTSVGDTPSDPIAEKILGALEKKLPKVKMRFDRYSDGDRDKEKNYHILKYTDGPAVLLELGFMDHKKDYDKLWDVEWQDEIVLILADVIEDMHNNGI